MRIEPLPRRQGLVDVLAGAGWDVAKRGSLRIATMGRFAVRINVVTGEVNVHGHGWTAAFESDVPDYVIVAAACARERSEHAGTNVEAAA